MSPDDDCVKVLYDYIILMRESGNHEAKTVRNLIDSRWEALCSEEKDTIDIAELKKIHAEQTAILKATKRFTAAPWK